jgi:hypothetical protein
VCVTRARQQCGSSVANLESCDYATRSTVSPQGTTHQDILMHIHFQKLLGRLNKCYDGSCSGSSLSLGMHTAVYAGDAPSSTKPNGNLRLDEQISDRCDLKVGTRIRLQ